MYERNRNKLVLSKLSSQLLILSQIWIPNCNAILEYKSDRGGIIRKWRNTVKEKILVLRLTKSVILGALQNSKVNVVLKAQWRGIINPEIFRKISHWMGVPFNCFVWRMGASLLEKVMTLHLSGLSDKSKYWTHERQMSKDVTAIKRDNFQKKFYIISK